MWVLMVSQTIVGLAACIYRGVQVARIDRAKLAKAESA
jgi:hypothetical protein